MELTPVYEGDSGFDQMGGDVVPLTQSMIQVLNVQTAEVKVQPLLKTLTVAGTIDDNATRHRVLSAYIPGRIEKLFVNYVGAEVKEGQPLAEFYSPALLQAEREYRTVSGEFRVSTASRLRQMGLTTAQLEALPNKPTDKLTSEILAPASGTVVAQYVYAGQYVEEGAPLFEIADFSVMWFNFQVYEQDLAWINLGYKVDVTTTARPGEVFTGQITFIDPNFDEATRSTIARVELENPVSDGRRLLLHRLYADGLVHIEAPEVLTVPRTSIIETGHDAVVYVDQGGGAYARQVIKTARRGDTLVEVTAGLAPGNKVVVNGNLLIDSQAEMNRVFGEPAMPSQTSVQTTNLPALTEAQRKTLRNVVALADALATSLAGDNLEQFNGVAVEVHKATSDWLAAFPANDPWRAFLKPFEAAGHIEKATDLKDARRMFHPFSTAAVALSQALRRTQPEFASVKIYRCPMTQTAFPGAPKQSDWVQLKEPLRNPYFGADMLDCGTEVKP
jgi:Cu(I)/Ag(I) efflux system membrane fusion protein